MSSYELRAIYDSHRSFYGKAIVEEGEDCATLYSYGVPVCRYDSKHGEGMFMLMGKWDYSATTLRHVREFLRQRFGEFLPITKKVLGTYREGVWNYASYLEEDCRG